VDEEAGTAGKEADEAAKGDAPLVEAIAVARLVSLGEKESLGGA